MLRKLFKKLNEWLEDGLRGLLGRMTPDRRVILVLTMLFVFGGLSIYMTVSSIYNIGKKSGVQWKSNVSKPCGSNRSKPAETVLTS